MKPMTYREMFDEVVMSGKYRTQMEKIKVLAQRIYCNGFDGAETKADAVWAALERYEDMTGRPFDPTQDQFDEIEASII